MSITEDLRDALTDSWERFSNLDLLSQNWTLRWILAAVTVFVFLTVMAWKVMVPLFLSAIGVTFYLRRSRGDDSL